MCGCPQAPHRGVFHVFEEDEIDYVFSSGHNKTIIGRHIKREDTVSPEVGQLLRVPALQWYRPDVPYAVFILSVINRLPIAQGEEEAKRAAQEHVKGLFIVDMGAS